MALKLIGTSSTVETDVDSTSKADKVTLYNSDGTPEWAARTYAGMAAIGVRQTAITNPGAVVWAIYNPTSFRTIKISRILLNCTFDGTSVATLMRYEMVKCTNVTAINGGTIVTPLNREETKVSQALIKTLDTGLTVVSGAGYFTGGTTINIVCGRVSATTATSQSYTEENNAASQTWPIVLLENELLAIRPTVITVVGDTIVGHITYKEYQ